MLIGRIGAIATALGLVLLVKQGFELGSFLAPLQRILDLYDRLLTTLLGWAEPYFDIALAYMFGWLGWQLHVLPHWKYVLVPLELYIAKDAQNALRGNWPGAKRTAVFRAMWGGLLTLAAAISAGTVALADAASSMLVAAIGVAAIVLYRLGWAIRYATERYKQSSWWAEFRPKAALTLGFATFGISALVLGSFAHRLPVVGELSNPGLTLLAVLVVALATYHLLAGAAVAKLRPLHESWWQAFCRQGNTRLGFLMFEAMGYALLFFAANAVQQ